MMNIIWNIVAIWFCLCVFTVIVGVSLANRIPAEVQEDDSVLVRVTPELPPYEEPEQLRKQREGYARRRSVIYLASQRERAEFQAVRGGK
jgi:hypothetical protein